MKQKSSKDLEKEIEILRNSRFETLRNSKTEILSLLFGVAVLIGFIYNYILFNVTLNFNIFEYLDLNEIVFSWIVNPYLIFFMFVLLSSIIIKLYPHSITLFGSLFLITISAIILFIPIFKDLVDSNFKYTIVIIMCYIILFYLILYISVKLFKISDSTLNNIKLFEIFIHFFILLAIKVYFDHKETDIKEIILINGKLYFAYFCIYLYYIYNFFISIFLERYKIDIDNLEEFIKILRYSEKYRLFIYTRFDNSRDKKIQQFRDKYPLNTLVNSLNTIRENNFNSPYLIEDIKEMISNNNIYYAKIYEDLCVKLINEINITTSNRDNSLLIKTNNELESIRKLIKINHIYETGILFVMFIFLTGLIGYVEAKMISYSDNNIVKIKFTKDVDSLEESEKLYKFYKKTSSYTIVKENGGDIEKEGFIIFSNNNIYKIQFKTNNLEKENISKTEIDNKNGNDTNIESDNNSSIINLGPVVGGVAIGGAIIPIFKPTINPKLALNFDNNLEYNKFDGVYYNSGNIIFEKEIFFDKLLFTPTKETELNKLKEVVENLKSDNKYVINIIGNASTEEINIKNNTIKDNYTLSLARANNIKKLIIGELENSRKEISLLNINFNIFGNSNQDSEKKSIKVDEQRFVQIQIYEYFSIEK